MERKIYLNFSRNHEFAYVQIILLYLESIHDSLRSAEEFYPGFSQWFYEKVVPGLTDGKREILVEFRGGSIAGLAIVKKESEKKLCTLKVDDAYKNRGLGIKLFQRSFEALDTEKPFLTVSEEKYPEFRKIFDYFGFRLTSIRKNLYRYGKKEYFFNEV